jgi:uncharacterized protein (TIGR00730 family)
MAVVCVYCSSADGISPAYLALATQVGERIAAGGHSLVTGGGRVSMMGAVARAARAHGGKTTGVIPKALVTVELADTDGELVTVETMRERKLLMDELSDAFLALPGGLGTLEELFEVWTAGTLHMHGKPVIALDPFGHYAPLWAYLDTLVASGFVRPLAMERLHRVTSVAAAFSVIESG